MAVPTITSLSPNSGPPHGGYCVRILGTNFREPVSTPFGPREVTVHVYIETMKIPDDWVEILSSSEIEIRVPQDESDPAVVVYPLLQDVTVQNVDSAGVPIPGEEVTESGAWTYERMPAAGSVPEEVVFRWLRRYLARNLPVPVTGSVHVDYQEDMLLTLPEEVKAPCVVLLGPRMMPAPEGTAAIQDPDESLGDLRLPKCYMHVYDVFLLDTNRKRLGVLRTKLTEAIRVMPSGVVVWSGGDVVIQARWQDPPSMVGTADFSGAVEQATGVLVVENVPETVDFIRGASPVVSTLDLGFE